MIEEEKEIKLPDNAYTELKRWKAPFYFPTKIPRSQSLDCIMGYPYGSYLFSSNCILGDTFRSNFQSRYPHCYYSQSAFQRLPSRKEPLSENVIINLSEQALEWLWQAFSPYLLSILSKKNPDINMQINFYQIFWLTFGGFLGILSLSF